MSARTKRPKITTTPDPLMEPVDIYPESPKESKEDQEKREAEEEAEWREYYWALNEDTDYADYFANKWCFSDR